MYVQQPPLIPSLRTLRGTTCAKSDCNFGTMIKLVDGFDVRYHNCVWIKNIRTSPYDMPASNTTPTVWYSSNTKNVGDLIVDFFEWMSNRKNLLEPKSITTNSFICPQPDWDKFGSICPDPFIYTRNIAYVYFVSIAVISVAF